MQISSSNFSNPNTHHVQPDDRSDAALHYQRNGASVWVWNVFSQDWISVSLGGGGGSQTPWTSNINGGGFNISNVGRITATEAVIGTAFGLTASTGGSLADGEVLHFAGAGADASLFVVDSSFSSGDFDGAVGSLGILSGTGVYVKYDAAPTAWGKILHESANVNTNGVYQKGGTQVVGAQGAAVADATDAATAITQLNALLARVRAHGLIA